MSSRRDDLITLYATHITEKFGVALDKEFLIKVTLGLGPAIYNQDASKVSGSDEKELERVKDNFLVKKLGLADRPELMDAVHEIMKTYGVSERNKYRAVVYYLLAKHFNMEAVYD